VEVAQLISQTGTICICAFVSPIDSVRQKFRKEIGADRFLMAHLSAPLEICRQRDTDGIYEAADRGEIRSVPGVSQPYEVPQDADLVLSTDTSDVEECVDALMELLRSKNRIG
jgi:bifunctional enzyme CysN/CysC